MDAIKEKAKGAVDAAKGAAHPPNGAWQSELFDCSKAMGSKQEGICVGPSTCAAGLPQGARLCAPADPSGCRIHPNTCSGRVWLC